MKTFKQFLDEGPRGLWYNIHAKRRRIARGSGERMRKPGSEGAPSKENLIDAQEETAAWTRSAGKNPKGGLNRKGIESYRRDNPGSKLSMAVTTKPSKLDPNSRSAKRRKAFCARMSGVDGPAKKPNGEPTRKTLALRKWNC